MRPLTARRALEAWELGQRSDPQGRALPPRAPGRPATPRSRGARTGTPSGGGGSVPARFGPAGGGPGEAGPSAARSAGRSVDAAARADAGAPDPWVFPVSEVRRATGVPARPPDVRRGRDAGAPDPGHVGPAGPPRRAPPRH